MPSGLFHLQYFAAFVMPTLWTDAMLQAGLLTVRTERCLRHSESIMGPSLAAACFGMSSFWIWHRIGLLLISINGKFTAYDLQVLSIPPTADQS